jgi:hypothetical protein
MRKLLLAVGALLLFAAAPVFAQGQQGNIIPQNSNPIHRIGSNYFASSYSAWQAVVITGNSTTGAGVSIVVAPQGGGASGVITLADGTNVPLASVFNTATPVYVNDANAETFTPSGVSIAPCTAGNLGVGGSGICATITGTIANTHGQGALLQSGDGGIEEAITDAGQNSGGTVYFERDCGLLTLSTSSTTSTAVNCQVPLNSVATMASVYVTTTITTAATYGVGFAGNTTLYIAACASLTAGLNCSAKNVAPAESATGTSFALSPVLVTTNANAGAGVVHLKVMGYSQVSSVK